MSKGWGNSARDAANNRDPDGGRGSRKAGKSRISATSYKGRHGKEADTGRKPGSFSAWYHGDDKKR